MPEPGTALIDNRTDLPDTHVREAVEAYFVENASVLGSTPSTFQTYSSHGSLLARTKFHTPANVYDEIRLARDLAERDDDIGAAMGSMIATAFADGMENHHADENTVDLFNGLAAHMNLDGVFKRMYREYLIASQVTTVSLFARRTAVDTGDGQTEDMVAPLVGVLPAEQIRTIGTDLFGNADLALIPDARLEAWLAAYFDPTVSAARKAELRRQDPVSAAMFTGPVRIDDDSDFTGNGIIAYRLNPRMVHRTSMPKDGCAPRPLLTRNFPLLEAKRLLNLMDYALLQGAINFIVVAKVGSDERPALQPEVDNLKHEIVKASRSGVLVGDHRIAIEIITPKLDELLNDQKRRHVGRKLAMGLLRVPEPVTEAPGGEGMKAEVEFVTRVIASDRHDLKRHVENFIYEECFKRNRALSSGAPSVWFPRIVLQGANYFTDYVLKLRDRGDISRGTAVAAGGFDFDSEVAERRRELAENIDEIMAPAAVPFSSPNAGPQDNNQGRPTGTSPDNGRPGAQPGPGRDNVRPLRTINRNAGETVRAIQDGEDARRVGERTFEILAEYADSRTVGRITPLERRALEARAPTREGPVAVIPVNPRYRVDSVRAVRLDDGLSMMLGTRVGDGALVAKALCFREPQFDLVAAEETALRWGFPIEGWAEEPIEEHARRPAPEPPREPAPQTVIFNAGRRTKKVVNRDEHGNITSIEDVPAEDE